MKTIIVSTQRLGTTKFIYVKCVKQCLATRQMLQKISDLFLSKFNYFYYHQFTCNICCVRFSSKNFFLSFQIKVIHVHWKTFNQYKRTPSKMWIWLYEGSSLTLTWTQFPFPSTKGHLCEQHRLCSPTSLTAFIICLGVQIYVHIYLLYVFKNVNVILL